MRILLIADIHANFVAVEALARRFSPSSFDLILNGGDSLVYGPFPNETLDWLRFHRVLSILGNTDLHVITLLQGNTFKKPGKAEKRIMYGWTAAELSSENQDWLLKQPLMRLVNSINSSGPGKGKPILSMFHGSPADTAEFLFPDTPLCRLRELGALVSTELVTVGHSHHQFSTVVEGVNFINPGSTGRMFDGKISAGCAILTLRKHRVDVEMHRIPYPAAQVAAEILRQKLPPVYAEMYLRGRKLN